MRRTELIDAIERVTNAYSISTEYDDRDENMEFPTTYLKSGRYFSFVDTTRAVIQVVSNCAARFVIAEVFVNINDDDEFIVENVQFRHLPDKSVYIIALARILAATPSYRGNIAISYNFSS